MSPAFYHILHLVAVMMLFIGTGIGVASLDDASPRKCGAIVRGIGLLLILVTGFGLLAKLGLFKSFPAWVWCKIGIWLVAAVLPVFVKRKILPGTAAVAIAVLLGAAAAWLGYLKPF